MKFRLEVEMNNAAFEDPDELSRILRGIAVRVETGDDHDMVRDTNGNCCGNWRIS